MPLAFSREFLSLIRAERDRRQQLLEGAEAEAADAQWLFEDGPLLNELCLLLLVAAHHQVERELLKLWARCGPEDEIAEELYLSRVKTKRALLKDPKGWDQMACKLGFDRAGALTETFRLLANCYKHDPWMIPDGKLAESLGDPVGVRFAPLPESEELRRRLAVSLGLDDQADYIAIAGCFLEKADSFLAGIEKRAHLGRVRREPAGFLPEDLAR
ncbi:MAG TPA: hypothetical protein VMV31_05470 [Terriglobales bacterium]|nr:hypothetical protein [Terriglobales bacterium]